MLVLSRKVGERIMIGDEIEIMIVRLTADKVRLGIVAPRSMRVDRSEVYEAMREDTADR